MTTATTSTIETDRIERSIHIKAPRSRVWQALTDGEKFGKWFGARLASQVFVPGAHVAGPIAIAGFEHVMFDAIIADVTPESLMSYRWHPYAIDPKVDYSKEQRTLVTFTLEDVDGGTFLTVVETGFDQLPLGRRAEALAMNTRGWTAQLGNIDRYVLAN